MPRDKRVGVGAAIAVVNNKGQILLLKRLGAHHSGKWACPGGWIDLGDKTIQGACLRELKEEAGLENIDPNDIQPLCQTTEFHDELGIRTVTLYHVLTYREEYGIPRICEPEKCSALSWVDLDKLEESELFPKLLEGLAPLRTTL